MYGKTVWTMEADKCTFLGLRQRRTSTSDSIGPQPPTASDLRQRRTSTSDGIGPPKASDFISDSVGVLSPTASDFYLRQRRTSISDSVGLLSPTASDFYLRQRRTWDRLSSPNCQVDAGRGQNVTFDPLYLENFLELECHRCLMPQP